MKNLFDITALPTNAEQFEDLFVNKNIRIERIVSFGYPTPQGEWYDQDETEWVSLLKGTSTLVYADGHRLEMVAGDAVLIPPHQKHRVEAVSVDAVWLAVFIVE